MISIHFIVHYLSRRRISAANVYPEFATWGFTLSGAGPNGAMDLSKTAIDIAGFVPDLFYNIKTSGYIFATAGFAVYGNLPLPYMAIQVINSKYGN